MGMCYQFAKRAANIRPSDIRELSKIVTEYGLISFGGGNPEASLFPVEELHRAMETVFEESPLIAFQYGVTEGYMPLREYIARQYMRFSGVNNLLPEEVFITSGSQMGINLVTKALCDEGDAIICERPTYSGFINATRPYGCKWIDIEMDDEGIRIDAVENALQTCHNVKYIYTIPDFQNPTGTVMSLARRIHLLELADRYRVPIIEDAPYSELCFNQKLPSLKSIDETGSVIYLGSFSKVISPGIRIGWICADRELIRATSILRQGVDLHSPVLNQMLVFNYLQQNEFKLHVSRLVHHYREKAIVMTDAIKRTFPPHIVINEPKGGFFIWFQIEQGVDIHSILKKSIERGVAFVPGGGFFAKPGGDYCGRLNYVTETHERIEHGISVLGEILHEL